MLRTPPSPIDGLRVGSTYWIHDIVFMFDGKVSKAVGRQTAIRTPFVCYDCCSTFNSTSDDGEKCGCASIWNVLCSKCSPSNIRRNETNEQHFFLVQWLIRLPGNQEVHGSIPCEGRVLFFCSVLWSYHHVAISVIRTRETIMRE